MQELSSSIIRKTIVPPSISTSGGSSCTEGPLLRFAGDPVFLAGDKLEGRFSAGAAGAVVVVPNLLSKVATMRGFTGCTEIGSCIGVEGFSTGVAVPSTDVPVIAVDVFP